MVKQYNKYIGPSIFEARDSPTCPNIDGVHKIAPVSSMDSVDQIIQRRIVRRTEFTIALAVEIGVGECGHCVNCLEVMIYLIFK